MTKIFGKFSNAWKLHQHLNNTWIKEEIKREIRQYFELNENTIHRSI